jgi:hypothetical protein
VKVRIIVAVGVMLSLLVAGSSVAIMGALEVVAANVKATTDAGLSFASSAAGTQPADLGDMAWSVVHSKWEAADGATPSLLDPEFGLARQVGYDVEAKSALATAVAGATAQNAYELHQGAVGIASDAYGAAMDQPEAVPGMAQQAASEKLGTASDAVAPLAADIEAKAALATSVANAIAANLGGQANAAEATVTTAAGTFVAAVNAVLAIEGSALLQASSVADCADSAVAPECLDAFANSVLSA